MKRALGLVVTVVVLLVLVVLFRAATVGSKQLTTTAPPAGSFDTNAVLARFSGALRIQTISNQDSSADSSASFTNMNGYIATTFPRLHATLSREQVGTRALLYTWTGADTTLQPLLLLSHLDVVPLEQGTEKEWKHAPFSGDIADGYVWGRGALDDKVGALALLEAVEQMVIAGVQPPRTIIIALGMDEEVGGNQGAARVAALLQSRDIKPLLILDEGGAILENSPFPVAKAMAAVGIAEKGSLSLSLTVQGKGGHSSTPYRESPIGILGAGIGRLESNPFPGSIRGPVAMMFEYLAPEMAFGKKIVFANLPIFGGMVEGQMAESNVADAMLRTTMATTMMNAGTKENVLPEFARAVVNFRLFPGDTPAEVIARVRNALRDPRVEVDTLPGSRLASDISPTDSIFEGLQRSISAVFPDVIVTPYLQTGGTDSRHYAALSEHVYRFMPVRLTSEDMSGIHGTNERVRIASYLDAIRFYRYLVTAPFE